MGVIEILGWICPNTRKYRRGNFIKNKCGPYSWKDEREYRWFGHIQRKMINAPVRRSKLI